MPEKRNKRRARYQDDPEQSGARRAPLPNDVWQPPEQRASQPLTSSDDWDAFRLAPVPQYASQPNDLMRPERSPSQDSKEQYFYDRSARSQGIWLAIVLVCVSLLAFMVFGVYKFYGAYPAYKAKLSWMTRDTFFDGIFVDGTHIGGLTHAQAQQALAARAAHYDRNLSLNVKVDDKSWRISANEVPFQRNVEAVLDAAFSIGRHGFSWGVENGTTPFETRFQHTQQTLRDKAYLSTRVTYDKADVRRVVEEIAGQINRPAVNAVVSTFDFNTRAFAVTQDVQGARLGGEELYQRITAVLDSGDYGGSITMYSEKIMPQVTSVELQNGFAQLSVSTTSTTSHQNRNVNISLAAQAINGTALMPGDSFSFNKATGERTPSKGYLPAPAIADGTTFDEPGGGVCQVSSTLFNAAAMAGLTIVDRSPHAWPASYIDKGLDATVNWPNLDFQFRNDKLTPIFIVSYYKERKVSVEIYGMRSGAGETIALATELVSTTNPPGDAIYEQNPLLPPGTQQEKKKARTGYVVNTYRLYLRDGREYSREKLCTSNYRTIQQVIEYN